ncbi:uncharacterized protein N0V96_007086 [Colletotrichum fioriniae]|uniref:uncharacterized protein n=1 Tax=Colletotrichum fioriniae TaxID=710243 RepID=UPI0032DB24AE|nr:hypothetical protein N0V96_007086 [Colletotrichum fioriniae]
MDPQIRLLLESVFESVENAGVTLQQLTGSDTSVFVGSFSRDYHDSLLRDPDTLPRTTLTGNGVAMMSNRISHFFDLRGPSLTTDTGCSASLAALHLAVNSIRNGESRMAIVGASNLLLNPDPFIVMSGLGVLGADGRCFAWDSRANGYGRGEGIATLLLKPLRDALADGDSVQAVIRETAINQDGKTPTITSPSSEAQEELIRACYRRAGLDPSQTVYVEAHMTGTPTGDPIEAAAISRIFSKGRSISNPVLVGSVKTNLGHLEASSGIAGVIKAIMMLKNEMIPPNLNYEKANPNIDMKSLGVEVPLKAQDWPRGTPRRVSVNNYGYGGTNGHVIIDSASEHIDPCPSIAMKKTEPRLIVMSSKDSNVTAQMANNLKSYLETRTGSGQKLDLDNLAHTLQARRSHFPWRVAISSTDCAASLVEALGDPVKKAVTLAKDPPRVGFVFNGQGAQWHAMGRELISVYAVFRKALLHADVVLGDYGADWSLVEELQRDEISTRVNEPRLSQPICVALQICLVDLLESWGIQPSAVTSHSSGEIAAAYAAGALTFEEALGVAYFRGVLTEKYHHASTGPGGMMAVGLGVDDAWAYLAKNDVTKGTVTVACVNSPSSVTLSGDLDAIQRLEKQFSKDQIFARALKVKSAYHSHHMIPMAEEYLQKLQNILQPKLKWQKLVYSSPVTGNLIENPEDLGRPQHWVNNLLWPVLFSQSFEKMCVSSTRQEANVDFIFELGPHSALAGPIRQICKLPVMKGLTLPYVSGLVRGQNAAVSMQMAAGALWCKGDIEISNALVIPDTEDGIEVQLSLHPCDDKNLEPGWYEFSLESPSSGGNSWTQHIHGYISQKLKSRATLTAAVLSESVPRQGSMDLAYTCSVKVEDLFARLRKMGLQHGPKFQNMLGIQASDSRSKFQFKLREELRFDVDPSELSVNKRLVKAAWYFIEDAIQDLGSDKTPITNMEWYHKSLYNWMKLNYKAGLDGTLAPGSASWAKASQGMRHMLFDEVAAQSVNGRLLCRVGKNLSRILRKQVAPLEVMMEGNLLYDFYEKALRCNRSYEQVQKLVHIYSMKHPRAKVLEVGGGTGGCTRSVLNGLSENTPDHRRRFSSYTFTDVSAGFFEAAAKKFEDFGDMITFRKLDIEVDPVEQSFEPCSYDLIVACQVLHATKNMEKTMRNVRKLLKKGGQLILVETTKDTLDVQLIFGALPGWWLAEEAERKGGPNLTLDHWGRVLANTGFSGVDLDMRDMEDPANYSFSVMTSTAIAPATFPSEVLILSPAELVPANWIRDLECQVQSRTGASCKTTDWRSVDATEKVCIMLEEAVAPLLRRLSREDFTCIQSLLTAARGVLWVTRGSLIDGADPDMALHSGLLRTLRMEDAGRRYISLDLESTEPLWSGKNAELIGDVFKSSFDFSPSSYNIDCEFAVKDSILYIPRIYHDDPENMALAPESAEQEPALRPFGTTDEGSNLQMEVGTPGLLDSLRFRQIELQDLKADQIEIKPRAFGLNFRDVLVALGQLDETIMGYECSGIITRMGPEAEHNSGLKIGDRVCAILRGHWASRVYINWPCAARVPDSMSFEEAATIPMVFATAYHGLFDIGRLSKGESVLIHAATGGVGQAAVMLAKQRGAEVFATVGTEAKRDFVMKRFGIPQDHIFSSRDTSFGTALMAATDGKGVDVVLNSLAGPLLKETWNCMARFGRFIEIGKRDIEAAKNLDMSPFRRAATFAAVDLFQLGKFKGHVVQNALQGVMEMFRRGDLSVVSPMTTFPISEVGKAFRLLQSGKHLGKIVIPSSNPARLLENASYLIAGGMGGIGQSIARWMSRDLGCKNLIILSRNARLGGNTSQANYSAGGTFQDAFARYRTSKGLPGVSIDLASIQEVGFVANTEGVAERLTKTGLADIDEANLLKIIETAIQKPCRPVDLSQLITGILEFDETSTVAWVNDTRFSSLRANHSNQSGTRGRTDHKGGAATRLSDSLRSATSGTGAVALILDAVISKLSEMFGLDAAEIDKKHPVSRYGVDSLIAVELRNWLVSSAGAETTSIFDVLHSPSLSVLAEKIGEKSRYVSSLVKTT